MSSIYKLSISGIRSFSDETQETIQFGKPLTLIVGTNGSGKTTIIECLRYATTNELPPNTKTGASFINDPSLHSSNETKAQIKLAFQNTKKINLILSKSLMASKNPRTKTISFKTKENQLMAIHHGEKQTISSKIADIENLIPQHLGVSKAILNYVIFCHQDESLWPISESAVLKKKFDEIFDSSKFIKILDSIKGITKDINSDIKLINNNVEHLKNDKIRAVNKRQSIKVLETQIRDNKLIMDELQGKIDELTKNLQNIYTSNQDYERTISKLESLQQDKKNMTKNIESIKLTTELLNKPKDQLLDDLNNFENVLAEQMKKVSILEDEIKLKSEELTESRDSMNVKLKEFGFLENSHNKNIENLKKKEEMISKFKEKLDVSNIEEFDNKLNLELSLLNGRYSAKKESYDNILNEISKNREDMKFSHSKEIQHLEYMNKDVKSLTSKIAELESRYVSITGNQTKLITLKEQLLSKEETLEKIKSLSEIANLNQLIDKESKSMNLLEVELEDTQNKLQITRLNNDIISKVHVFEDMNKSAKRELNVAFENIKNIIHADSKDTLVDQYFDEVKNIEKVINKSRAELETKKFRKSKLKINYENNLAEERRLRSALDDINKKYKELQLNYQSVYGDSLDIETYDSTLNNVENDYNEEFADFKDIQFLFAFNTRAIKSAEKKQICYLCRRKFDDNDPHQREQLPKFIELLQNRNSELSSKVGMEQALNKKETVLNKLRDFKSSALKFLELKNKTIPDLVKVIAEDKDLISKYDDEMEAIELDLTEKKTYFNKLKNLEQDISIFKHQSSTVSDTNEQINRLNDKLSDQGLLNMSSEDLEKLNKEIYTKLKNLRSLVESLKLDREMKQKRNNELENDINQLKLSINELELKSVDKVNIEKAVEEARIQITDINKNIEISKYKTKEFEEKITELDNDYQSQLSNKDNALNEIQVEIDGFEQIKSHFAKINDEINSFAENDIENKFMDCKVKISNQQKEIEKLNKSINEKNNELKKLEAIASDSSNQERNIRSNLNLIQFVEELNSIQREIDQLDTKQAYAQRDEYLLKTSKLQETQKEYQKEFATKLGETSQLERQMKDIYSEIDRDYKDIDSKYTKEYSKLQTKLAMATDLTTLYKATDNGVMEFHQTQMFKINNIIDELWKKTYTGNDVETIKIKADPIAAKKTTTTTASNNRSYNYRVVMIKNGTELDMRGRCSAGQKVLASIIIRIALAECFCLNFGMIALDEPTTNLDDENVESLAKALHAIIQERSAQRNFQLIIITHDEKFLRCMNAVDFTDHYYRVMRNERLNSTINKVSIATVTE
jgi:DNA repair protein RAD50